MTPLAWTLVAVLTVALGAMAVVAFRARTALTASRAEAAHLRELVKKKVERPNVFSHEVRTPLTLIKGAAELLAEETPGPLTPRQHEFVHTIAVQAEQVIALAEDLLTEAKIDAQLFDLRLERVDLKALVRETVRDARRLHHTPIALADQPGPLLLMADRKLLGQALWNLVNNACRHAGPDARVSVSVSESEGQAIVAVTDDGGGMSPEERGTMFESFTVGREQPGTGLGMMITERIVAQHGGRLLVDTVEGRGTTVYFTIPVEREAVDE